MDNADGPKNREEILKSILSDYRKNENKELVQEKERFHKGLRQEKIHQLFMIAGVCLIFLLVIRLFFVVINESGILKPLECKAMGKRVILDKKTEKCIGNLWKTRKAIDEYYAAYREFPRNMNELYEAGYLQETMVCPLSGKEYTFSEVNGEKIFSCPNPERHGASSIQCNVESAVPIIKR